MVVLVGRGRLVVGGGGLIGRLLRGSMRDRVGFLWECMRRGSRGLP